MKNDTKELKNNGFGFRLVCHVGRDLNEWVEKTCKQANETESSFIRRLLAREKNRMEDESVTQAQ